MDIDKQLLVTIALTIHMALIGLALVKLFKLKNATGGLVIISLLVFMIPIVGPSGLIVYLDKQYKKHEQQIKKRNNSSKHSPKKAKK